MEPIAVNRRKNEQWQSVELARAYYGSLRTVKIYRAVFALADLALAALIIYKLATRDNSNLTLIFALFAASAAFTAWLAAKPYIDGKRMYLESLLDNGEDYVSETRLYADRIEYYSDDEEKRSSIPLDRVYNAFETENLYEIQLAGGDGGLTGHLLLKSGFVKGGLDDVKRLVPPGYRSLPKQ